MCQQLIHVVKILPSQVINEKIFPELLELLKDEDTNVIVKAWEVTAEIMQYFSKDIFLPSLYNSLFLTAIKDPDLSQSVVEIIASNIGIILQKLVEVFNVTDTSPILKFYQSLMNKKSKHLKYSVAYNFPAMVKICKGESFKTQFLPIWEVTYMQTYIYIYIYILFVLSNSLYIYSVAIGGGRYPCERVHIIMLSCCNQTYTTCTFLRHVDTNLITYLK